MPGYGSQIPLGRKAALFGDLLVIGKRDRDGAGRRRDAGATPPRLARRFDPAHGGKHRQRYYLFRLSAPSGRTHNRLTMKTACSVGVHWPHGWRIKDVRENLRRVGGVDQARMG